ncbi:MAG: hypothetical protein UT79_C0009G0005 [Candidatus Moranbacteria bacterium GW2011_GWC2_40_12]|nr:MAG: hypothetical protein UT79_C0009G0005 [Candidatus Moranbacteria bacterium GW2011_GWC2_40_12]
MNAKQFIKSRLFIGIIMGIFCLALLVGSFQIGMMIGFRKAQVSYAWSEHYDRNFGGPRRAIMGMPIGTPQFMGAFGNFGTIIRIDDPAIIVSGSNNTERIIITDSKTQFINMQDKILRTDLKLGDNIVIIGESDDQGQIMARLIRLLK